ncbi:hypothetical protein ElyMa_006644000, partial [Elysia marginata]
MTQSNTAELMHNITASLFMVRLQVVADQMLEAAAATTTTTTSASASSAPLYCPDADNMLKTIAVLLCISAAVLCPVHADYEDY